MSDPSSEFPSANDGKKSKRQSMARRLLPAVLTVALLGVVAVIGMSMVTEIMLPPQRPLVPAPGPAVAANHVPLAQDPALVAAFGTGAIGLAGRNTACVAAIGADAITCGQRDQNWVDDLRAAMVADVAARTNSYDGRPEDTILLRRFLSEHFLTTFQTRAQEAMPDRAQRCADLPAHFDFRAADLLVRTQRAAPAR